jgi:uncharacterized OB-fold protein
MASTTEYKKPLPTLNDANRVFWEGANQGKLMMQKCGDCGHIRFPISHVCPDCLSYTFDWTELSGRGEVFSYIVFYQLYNKAFADDIPYNVAMIQLAEGPRMISNVVGVDSADDNAVKVGDEVQVVFEQATPEIAIPKFRLCER